MQECQRRLTEISLSEADTSVLPGTGTQKTVKPDYLPWSLCTSAFNPKFAQPPVESISRDSSPSLIPADLLFSAGKSTAGISSKCEALSKRLAPTAASPTPSTKEPASDSPKLVPDLLMPEPQVVKYLEESSTIAELFPEPQAVEAISMLLLSLYKEEPGLKLSLSTIQRRLSSTVAESSALSASLKELETGLQKLTGSTDRLVVGRLVNVLIKHLQLTGSLPDTTGGTATKHKKM